MRRSFAPFGGPTSFLYDVVFTANPTPASLLSSGLRPLQKRCNLHLFRIFLCQSGFVKYSNVDVISAKFACDECSASLGSLCFVLVKERANVLSSKSKLCSLSFSFPLFVSIAYVGSP